MNADATLVGVRCAVCGDVPPRAWIPIRGDAEYERIHGGKPVAHVCGVEHFEQYCRAHPGTGGPLGAAAFEGVRWPY